MNLKIKGIGTYLPGFILTNDNISAKVEDTSSEWIKSKLGIEERRVSIKEPVSTLGYQAALNALEDAEMTPEEIDLIINITSSPEKIAPPTASIIHNKLNIKKDVPAFDMNAVCSGFVYGLSVAKEFSDKYENILVIACERYSANTNWNDKHCVFFGDGAGAVIVSKSDVGVFNYELFSNGRGKGMTGFSCEFAEPFIQKGKEVWEHAVEVLPDTIKIMTKKYGNNIDILIPHQPSINLLKEIAKKADFPFDKVKTIMHKYGNVASASIPIALEDALLNEQVKNGDRIMLLGVGSGWSWGSIVFHLEYK